MRSDFLSIQRLLGLAALDVLLAHNMRLDAPHVILSLLFPPHRDPTGAIAPLIEPGGTLGYEAFILR